MSMAASHLAGSRLRRSASSACAWLIGERGTRLTPGSPSGYARRGPAPGRSLTYRNGHTGTLVHPGRPALSSAIMPRLLVVHHTPSPALQEMFEAAVSGARTDEIDDVEVIIRPALTAAAAEVLEADGYLLGTPANIGYMSGALKHFFDGIYYPCLEATRGRPYALYVHGSSDTTGAVRAVESITTGLGWRRARPPLSVLGPPSAADLEGCWELRSPI